MFLGVNIYEYPSDSFIIVAAHSNAAVDLLVKELILDIPYENLVRITSKAWLPQMSLNIRKYATKNKEVFQNITSRRYRNVRVICGTLQILGSKGVQLPKKATHLFVDEAGQASEPDVLIPWTKFLSMYYEIFLKFDYKSIVPLFYVRYILKSLQTVFSKLFKKIVIGIKE